jgi:tRNA1Val (adenine37-N6)-methyltransferase
MKSSKLPEMTLRPGESVDDFLEGRLKLIQSKSGYRFSIDAILLSEFVTIKKGDMVADLGTGCGIIPLILLLTTPVDYVFGLEIQAELAEQASRNALLNGLSNRLAIVRGDIRHPPIAPSFVDVVVCNPPYRKKDSGRINPDPQRAIARHEILASLDDILDTASIILRPKGRLALIYPVGRLVDVMVRLRRLGMEPKRIRIIYPAMKSEAKLALVEASKGGRPGLKVLPPLMEQGDYSN